MGASVSSGPLTAGPQILSLVGLAGVSSTFQQSASSTTTPGCRYFCDSARTVLGAKIRWKRAAAGTETVTVELWDASGTKLDTATISANVDGTYSCSFPSSHAVAAYTRFTISARRTDSAAYCYFTSAGLTIKAPPLDLICSTNGLAYMMGPYLYFEGFFYNASAGAYPSTTITMASQGFAIDPILDVT